MKFNNVFFLPWSRKAKMTYNVERREWMLRVGKTFAISLVLSQWNSQPKVHSIYTEGEHRRCEYSWTKKLRNKYKKSGDYIRTYGCSQSILFSTQDFIKHIKLQRCGYVHQYFWHVYVAFLINRPVKHCNNGTNR